jgi:crotonobetainyl-CoA:carnitine CoA-transferase CaiB-like acyl-CoA transferase
MRDPHFVSRGLFARTVGNESGARLKALPMPVAARFRNDASHAAAPRLGQHNRELLGNEAAQPEKTGESR